LLRLSRLSFSLEELEALPFLSLPLVPLQLL